MNVRWRLSWRQLVTLTKISLNTSYAVLENNTINRSLLQGQLVKMYLISHSLLQKSYNTIVFGGLSYFTPIPYYTLHFFPKFLFSNIY